MALGECLACGSAAGVSAPGAPRGRLAKRLRREDIEELSQATKLSEKEVRALYSRFRRMAPQGFLNEEQFRNTMGLLGLTDDAFIPERMFKVFDADQDGRLSFREFATSLAVMIRGTEDEKLKLSFDMTAGQRGATGISLEDFQRLIQACNTMLSSLVVPTRGLTARDEVEKLFHDLSSDEGCVGPDGSGDESPREVITLEAYKAAAQSDEAFLTCLGLHAIGSSGGGLKRTVSGAAQRARSNTNLVGGPSFHGGFPMSPSPSVAGASVAGGPPVPAGHHVVSAAQMEALRERVARVSALLQQGEPQCRLPRAVAATPATPSRRTGAEGPRPAATSSASDEDPNERWWTPAPTRKPAPLQNVSSGATALDDVCADLDRMLAWHGSSEMADVLGVVGAVSSASIGTRAFDPPGRSPSRPEVAAREGLIPEDNKRVLLKSNVHRVASKAAITQETSSSDFKDSGSDYDRPKVMRSKSLNNLAAKRGRKRHRLLGPKKGLAVHFGHENWNMVLSMMVGMRMAAGRSRMEVGRELQPVDFVMKEKFSIIPRIANIFDAQVSQRVTMTRFIDYAPLVFQRIRTSFGIQHDDYVRAIGPEQLLGNMVLGNLSSLSELSSEGKSGAFFYYTADGNYMLKTVTPKEYQLLRRMLKGYHDHIFQNSGTLLVRFLGLHCLSVRKTRKGIACGKTVTKLYFVVMANMFNTPFEIHRRYDLKGSWVGRATPTDKVDLSVALKDVDFQTAKETIDVGEDRRATLVRQLESDSTFLAANNIIDYSLLLGIHDCSAQDCLTDEEGHVHHDALPTSPTSGTLYFPAEVPVHRKEFGGMLSQDKKSLYFLGVIDILTPYDTFKVLEHNLKGLRYDRRGVSCCPPTMYAERFNKFMRGVFS